MSDVSIWMMNWIDLIQTPAAVGAIIILLLKRRVWVALFGTFMAVTGVVLHFPLFRAAGAELGDWWWWTWRGQGFAVLALLIFFALSPPVPESWWDRQRARGDTEAVERVDRSLAGGILSMVFAGFATLSLIVPVAAVLFTDSVIDLAETWPLFVLWVAVAVIGWTIGIHLLARGRNSGRRAHG